MTALEETQRPSLQGTNSSSDNPELAEQLGRLQLVTQPDSLPESQDAIEGSKSEAWVGTLSGVTTTLPSAPSEGLNLAGHHGTAMTASGGSANTASTPLGEHPPRTAPPNDRPPKTGVGKGSGFVGDRGELDIDRDAFDEFSSWLSDELSNPTTK